MATTTVTVPKDGPMTATSIIESHPSTHDDESTPRNRKRSFTEPQTNPSAPPLCNTHVLNLRILEITWFFAHLIDMMDSEWELPEGKTPVAIPRPSANPTLSAHSVHGMGGTGYLRTMASGGRIIQRLHNFSQKTIIKPENCLPCGNRWVPSNQHRSIISY